MMLHVPRFSTVDEYASCFNDAGYWRPYVAEICRRHGIAPRDIVAGLAGTFPVFLVDGRLVVKLFGRQFDGALRFEIERSVYGLLQDAPYIAAPALLHTGRLFANEPEWSWPYLISTALPGRSLGEDRAAVPYADLEAVVGWLGGQLRSLYELHLPPGGVLPADWSSFHSYLRERRAVCVEQHRRWSALPPHLLEQIEAYLLPVDALFERRRPPCLVHSDLNEDHVLGRWEAGHWRPRGMIDFGDALSGDPLYELVAFHFGLAHCDKHLLRVLLDATGHGLERDPAFVHRAMSYTLLFEHNVLGQVLQELPHARDVASLDELATLLWDLERR